MKFAASYRLISDMEFEDGIKKLKEFGYDGVELAAAPVIENPVVNSRAREITDGELPGLCERAQGYAEIVRGAGLEIIGFMPGNFTMCFFEDEFFENYYRVAAALGSPNLKVAGMIYRPETGTYWELLEENRRKLKVLAGYSEKYGVRTLIELHHGYLNESCSGAYNILQGFDPALVGVIHDPQNMVIAGKERWRMGLEILGDYLAYVHFKNSYFKKTESGEWKWELCGLSEGLVDWGEFVQGLKDTGFDGYLCNEYLGNRETVPMESYLLDELEYMKKLVSS